MRRAHWIVAPKLESAKPVIHHGMSRVVNFRILVLDCTDCQNNRVRVVCLGCRAQGAKMLIDSVSVSSAYGNIS